MKYITSNQYNEKNEYISKNNKYFSELPFFNNLTI